MRRRDEARRAVAQQGLKPELVNRIDEVVVFRALEKADVAGIAEGLLE